MRLPMLILPFAALGAVPALAAADPVLGAAQAVRAEQLKLLETLVDIDSGTGDKVGGQKASELVASELRGLGMTVELVPAELATLPDNVVARLRGTGAAGKGGRILMIAHSDTVFGPGTVAKRPFRIDGNHAYGAGVIDEKGGVVEGIFAIRLLKTLQQRDFASITFLIETSEERGSPGTRALIDKLLADADVELNLEPGDEPDTLTVWRKGSSNFTIAVKGRPAHAGVAPQNGRNAALELIHQVQLAGTLPTAGQGLTSNLTLLSAGSRYNIIPEDASATFNVRVREAKQAEDVEAQFRRNASTTVIPDTKVTVTTETSFPPLPVNPATEALAATAARLYGRIGGVVANTGNGGASESALAFAKGVPALDGLGPVGGAPHTAQEFLDLQTLTPRLYLLTSLLIELGKQPPVRAR